MFKNWKGICGLRDANFRLFVALCADDAMLAKVQKGFPELFLAEKPEQPGPFPLSYLRRAADEKCKGKYIGDVIADMHNVMSEVGMTYFWYGAPGKKEVDIDIPITPEHRASFAEVIKAARDKVFPWQLNRVTINGIDFFTGAWTGDDADDIDVDIYPAALVDINA